MHTRILQLQTYRLQLHHKKDHCLQSLQLYKYMKAKTYGESFRNKQCACNCYDYMVSPCVVRNMIEFQLTLTIGGHSSGKKHKQTETHAKATVSSNFILQPRLRFSICTDNSKSCHFEIGLLGVPKKCTTFHKRCSTLKPDKLAKYVKFDRRNLNLRL